jgi:hypothetical protein
MEVNRKHIFTIIGVSLLFKVMFMLFSYFVLFQGFDPIDLKYYYEHCQLLLQGQIPYIDFGFDYPPVVFAPILIAMLTTKTLTAFSSVFMGLMVLCDVVTALCVYLLALEILGKENIAFRAALLYATALEVAYYALTKFDAFPTMLLMIALLLTIRGVKVKGYYALALGVLAKIFPVVAGPFIFLYNAKKSSVSGEIRAISWRVLVPLGSLTLVAVAILATVPRDTTGSWARGPVFVNTIMYTIYAFLHDLLGLTFIPLSFLVGCGFLLMFGIFILLAYCMYSIPSFGSTPRGLLSVVLIAIFSFVALWSYHSPQYFFWYIPLIAVLIADDIWGMVLFVAVQILAFMEFPQLSGYFWQNAYYIFPLDKDPWGWAFTWFFFAVYLSSTVYLVYRAVRARKALST